MKLSQWAKKQGISYRTAWSWFHNNQIPNAYQSPSSTIIVNEPQDNYTIKQERVVVYCRISSPSRKKELDYQVKRCTDFCANVGFTVDKVFKEIASGMNDHRRELMKLLDYNPTIIVVENKDRLTRFGFNYLKVLLKKQKCRIVVINNDDDNETDLIKDLVAVITSFCCRLYGLRRGKNKASKIKKILDEQENK